MTAPHNQSQPTTEHTPTPWRLRTTGNMGNLIEADSGKSLDHLDDGYRIVATYQECCASDKYQVQDANRRANGAFIVEAVNNYAALRAKVDELRDDYLRRHKDATDRWMALKLAELALCKASLTDAERISDALIAIRAALSVNSQDRGTEA